MSSSSCGSKRKIESFDIEPASKQHASYLAAHTARAVRAVDSSQIRKGGAAPGSVLRSFKCEGAGLPCGPKQIFVFGSNTEGRHGKGAALVAKHRYGAMTGYSEGLMGSAYAVVCKNLRLGQRSVPIERIRQQVDDLIIFAQKRPSISISMLPHSAARMLVHGG